MRRMGIKVVGLVLLGFGLACSVGKELEGDDAGECSDQADNDVNGLFDCDDPGCEGSPACDDVSDTPGDAGGGTSSYAGAYEGVFHMESAELNWDICEGEISVTVEEDGSFSGYGGCPDEELSVVLDLSMDGSVGANGGLSGVVEFDCYERDGWSVDFADCEGTVTGRIEHRQISAEYVGAAGGDDLEFGGLIEAWP